MLATKPKEGAPKAIERCISELDWEGAEREWPEGSPAKEEVFWAILEEEILESWKRMPTVPL